jgi:hypothetical protein
MGGVLPFAQVMRLVWIDWALDRAMALNRTQICAAFGVSIPTASADLQEFARRFPGRMIYDRSIKGYLRGAEGQVYPGWVRVAVSDAVEAVDVAQLVHRITPDASQVAA